MAETPKQDDIQLLDCAVNVMDQEDVESPEALADRYLQYLAFVPDSKQTWYNLGVVYLQQGNLDGAENAFSKVMDLDNTMTLAMINLGAIYFARGAYDECIKANKAALKQEPGKAVPMANLALAYLVKDEVDEAISMAKLALEVEPKYPQAHNVLAVAYETKKDAENCMLHYKEAVELGFEMHPAFVEKVERLLGGLKN